jgi:hypothetical protein
VRFFLDNNLPPVWAEALTALVRNDGHEVLHLRQKSLANVTDVEWLTRLASEGGWVIISGDVRITRNQHERQVWLRSGLVGFFMGKAWASHPFWEKSWRIVRWWPRVVQQAQLVKAPVGFEIPVNFGSGRFTPMSLK